MGEIATRSSETTDVTLLVDMLSDQAAVWATEQMFQRYDGRLSPTGTRGRLQTRRELAYQLQFLVGALATGEPRFFEDYVRWLAGTLRRRGTPWGSVAEPLVLLRRFFAERLAPELFAPVERALQAGLMALRDAHDTGTYLDGVPTPPALPHTEALTAALIGGDIEGARVLVEQVRRSDPDYVRIATRLFQPSMYSIGALWEENLITVGQEHLASVMVQTLLTRLYAESEAAQPVGRKALFSCVEGNYHALGMRVVSDSYELNGWTVEFLGANVPTDSLLVQVDMFKPDMVGISASMVQHFPALRHAVAGLRGEFGGRCPTILVGGLATNRIEEAWKWIGADEWCADAEQARRLGP